MFVIAESCPQKTFNEKDQHFGMQERAEPVLFWVARSRHRASVDVVVRHGEYSGTSRLKRLSAAGARIGSAGTGRSVVATILTWRLLFCGIWCKMPEQVVGGLGKSVSDFLQSDSNPGCDRRDQYV